MTEDYVIDNNPYLLKKDVDGNRIPINEIQKVIFSIVLEIDRVCRKNNIPYALAFGSALGIYNYGGFIPWDDDADIAIDYFDLSRLIAAFEKDLSSEYEFICYEKDDRYNVLIPTIKVKKRMGYMREKPRRRRAGPEVSAAQGAARRLESGGRRPRGRYDHLHPGRHRGAGSDQGHRLG